MPNDPPFEITTQRDKWRFRCRADERYGLVDGHTNWFPIDGKFRCWECARQQTADPEIDPEYTHLRDQVTGALVSRGDIQLDVEPSPVAAAD